MLIQIGRKGTQLLFINPARVMCASVYEDPETKGYRWLFEIEGGGAVHTFRSRSYEYECDCIEAYGEACQEAAKDGYGIGIMKGSGAKGEKEGA